MNVVQGVFDLLDVFECDGEGGDFALDVVLYQESGVDLGGCFADFFLQLLLVLVELFLLGLFLVQDKGVDFG